MSDPDNLKSGPIHRGKYNHLDISDPVFNLEEEMDVSNTLWYKILTLLGRIICSLVGHSYPIDDNYCERCDHYYYD